MTNIRNNMQKPLPKGWKMVRLAEVCSINPPKPVLKDDEEVTFLPMSAISDNGTVINRQIRLYGKVKKGYTGFIENDILFAKITPCMENGKGVIAKDLVTAVGFGSTEFHVVRASQDILPEIIFRYLSLDRIRKYAKNNMVGSAGQKRVPDIFLKSLQLPLPPLPAQHKIVEILEEADNLRKLRRQADDKMKDLIPSLFVQMFGDPATNPKGWEVRSINSIKSPEKFSIVDGPFGSAMKVSDYVEDGIPVIQVGNITPDGFNDASFRYISEEKYQSIKRSTVKSGDILIAKVGHTIGKACIMPNLFGKAVITANCAKIKVDESLASTVYINHFINTPSFQKQIRKELGNTAKPMMNLTSIKNFQIFLPPLPLQQEFAKLVEEVESEKARQTESRKKLDELFNSLMQRAFTGELVA